MSRLRYLPFLLCLFFFASCEENEDPSNVDQSALIGRWQKVNGTECRRFDSNGHGVKWDPSDDVMEEEGKRMNWHWEDSRTLYIEFEMDAEIGGSSGQPTVVPEDYFTVVRADATNLVYKSDDGFLYSFKRI